MPLLDLFTETRTFTCTRCGEKVELGMKSSGSDGPYPAAFSRLEMHIPIATPEPSRRWVLCDYCACDVLDFLNDPNPVFANKTRHEEREAQVARIEQAVAEEQLQGVLGLQAELEQGDHA